MTNIPCQRTVENNKARTAVYRLYDDSGRLLYLGIARMPKFRWEQHELNKAWWHLVARKTVEWYENRAEGLAEEVRATAAEKPLYDMSWHKTKYHPEGGYDDTADRQAVKDLVTSRVQDGTYPPGMYLSTTQVAKECGVARSTASYVMFVLCGVGRRDPGILMQTTKHGRYEVRQPSA